MNGNVSKETLGSKIEALQQSLEVKPLSYVDQNKFYSCVDAAFKVYEQLLLEKGVTRDYAWCVANCLMYSWYLKSLFGSVLSGEEVEKEVYAATSNPTYYMIKRALIGTMQLLMMTVIPYFGLSKIGGESVALHTISFYIISSIINFIKLAITIKKRKETPLDALKPTST